MLTHSLPNISSLFSLFIASLTLPLLFSKASIVPSSLSLYTFYSFRNSSRARHTSSRCLTVINALLHKGHMGGTSIPSPSIKYPFVKYVCPLRSLFSTIYCLLVNLIFFHSPTFLFTSYNFRLLSRY